MRNARLDEAQAGIKISGENIRNTHILVAESEEEPKSLLMKVQEESEKAGLEFSTEKTKIMASGPITSWQIGGEKVVTVTDIYFLGLQNHCRLWLQPCNSKMFAPWKKSHGKPRQCIKKQRYHFANKGPYSQAIVFPVVMYRNESWTMKKAEHQRIDAFKLWCWIRLLRAPWTARRSSQLILKEINPEYSSEGLILKLELQYFGHLVWIVNSLEKILILGKTEGRRRKGQQRMRGLNGITDSMDMSLSKFWEKLKDREAWRAAVHRVGKNQTHHSDRTTPTTNSPMISSEQINAPTGPSPNPGTLLALSKYLFNKLHLQPSI